MCVTVFAHYVVFKCAAQINLNNNNSDVVLKS